MLNYLYICSVTIYLFSKVKAVCLCSILDPGVTLWPKVLYNFSSSVEFWLGLDKSESTVGLGTLSKIKSESTVGLGTLSKIKSESTVGLGFLSKIKSESTVGLGFLSKIKSESTVGLGTLSKIK
jgi:hypothetical protein